MVSPFLNHLMSESPSHLMSESPSDVSSYACELKAGEKDFYESDTDLEKDVATNNNILVSCEQTGQLSANKHVFPSIIFLPCNCFILVLVPQQLI
jgi:hypothetical protein